MPSSFSIPKFYKGITTCFCPQALKSFGPSDQPTQLLTQGGSLQPLDVQVPSSDVKGNHRTIEGTIEAEQHREASPPTSISCPITLVGIPHFMHRCIGLQVQFPYSDGEWSQRSEPVPAFRTLLSTLLTRWQIQSCEVDQGVSFLCIKRHSLISVPDVPKEFYE